MPKTTTAPLPGRILACAALLCGLTLSASAFAQMNPAATPQPAQGPAGNPMCPRLEAQLATIDHGGSNDPGKDDQIRRYQEAQTKQQGELDHATQQAKRM